jgi:UMF1 family MFS transporter
MNFDEPSYEPPMNTEASAAHVSSADQASETTEIGYSRREQFGWYIYDWANSAFSTTVVTAFLGPYLTTVTKAAADADGFVHPFGLPVRDGSFFSYVIALSVVLQVFFLPILGAIADYSNRKKQMLGIFAYGGAIATIGLYFLQGTNYLLGGVLFLIANLCFGASIVFYNAFLPDIAGPDERDRVSSEGWAAGYLGGGLLLLINLFFVQFLAEPLGLSLGDAVRISLASAGIWWAIFTLVPLATLKRRRVVKSLPPGQRLWTVGFSQLRHTLSRLPSYPHTLLFLIAFLLYNDGIQAVITLSAQFGQEEIGIDQSSLALLVLMVQFVAFFGALGFNRLAQRIGSQRAVIGSLVIWVGCVVYAFWLLQTPTQFFIMGAVIALVLGGSQALSRSLFSLMIPAGQEAEYFSLYEISERGTSWLAPLAFGLIFSFTGSYRLSILSVAIFLIAGLLVLTRVNVRRAIEEAGNIPPARV